MMSANLLFASDTHRVTMLEKMDNKHILVNLMLANAQPQRKGNIFIYNNCGVLIVI